MSERTALEYSKDLLAMNDLAIKHLGYDRAAIIDGAAILIDNQHAEIARLRTALMVIANGKCLDLGAAEYADAVLLGKA